MAQPSPSSPPDDPFASLLNLEETYYTEGYTLGFSDGSRAGEIEGRTFGLEQSLQKTFEMGILSGRAAVWSARQSTSDQTGVLPPLKGSERLSKHVRRLGQLTDHETLDTRNSEEAVSAFEDRFKDARAKGALIAKILREGEGVEVGAGVGSAQTPKSGDQTLRKTTEQGGKGSREMEDFRGLPAGKRGT